jgi:hypothetical protein
MAYDANELFQSQAGVGSGLRAQATSVQPKTLAGGTGTVAKLTPLAFNTQTGFWVIWDQDGTNGTNTIQGFLWPDSHTLVNGSETIANVMLGGRIHVDDIPVVVANYSLAQLKTALRSGIREKGFIIEGLDAFR